MERINTDFSIFQQKYYKSTDGIDAKNYTSVNISNVLWNKYKYFHRDVINGFVLNIRNTINSPRCEADYFDFLIATLSHIFSKNEITEYVRLYLFKTDPTINAFKEIIIDKTLLFNTKIMLSDNTNLLSGTGNEELYCKDYTGVIQSFILDYTNKLKTIKKLKQNILNTNILSLDRYTEMFKYYKNSANDASQTHKNANEPIMTINSPLFREEENKQFIQLICKHQIECDKVDKTIATANAEYLDVWCKLYNITYKIVSTYTDLHIWEENENSINITSIVGLVSYYTDNEKLDLVLNANRGLCIPFLLIPTNNKHNKLLMDLLHNSTAIPIFKTVNIPKHSAIANLRIIIKLNNLPVVNDIRVMCSNITDNDIDILFGDETDIIIDTKKKRKRPKRKKTELIKPTIDISNIAENDIVELTTTETPDEVELIYEKDDPVDERDETTDEDEPIVLETIENINNDTIVLFNKLPFNIVFYKYEYISFADKDLITFMITDLFNTNNKFKIFMEQYNTIRIIQSFHKDYNGLDKSIHFNGVFYNTDTLVKSTVYHFYIKNNCISTLTTIINVI